MRTFTFRSLLAIVACVLIGRVSSINADPPAAKADKAADTKAFVMESGGAKVLKLTAPADINCAVAEGSLHFKGPKYEVEFWLASGAKTVDEAVGRVATQIVSEFKEFKVKTTTDLTIAGAPAKRLVGTGREADDDDPGTADVIVFKVGDRIFVACTHGEVISEAGQKALLALTETAQLP